MKIKIVNPGWEKFTGYFGIVEFLDGVSVGEVSSAEARYLSAIVRVEDVATGQDPSAAAQIVRSVGDEMIVSQSQNATEEQAASDAIGMNHTRTELEEIADAQGIKGVREIADKFGIKGNSIQQIIDALMSLKPKVVAPTEDAAG